MKVCCPVSGDSEKPLSLQEIKQLNYKPFLLAVRRKRIDVVIQLLELGIDPNVRGGEGLIAAVESGSMEMVSLFLGRGANINKPFRYICEEEFTWPLCVAVKQNSLELTRFLLERGADVNVGEGKPLLYAFENENLEMLQLLLERGADVWGKCGYYILHKAAEKGEMFTVLFEAAKKNPHLNGLHNLLVYCINRQFKTAINIILEGNLLHSYWLTTPLNAAIHAGDLETVEAIVLRGVGVEESSHEIYCALKEKQWHIAKFFLGKGWECNPNVCLPMCVECPELVEFFLKQGVTPDCIQSAFQEAVLKRCKRSVEILLEHGATPTPDLIPRMIEMNIGILGL